MKVETDVCASMRRLREEDLIWVFSYRNNQASAICIFRDFIKSRGRILSRYNHSSVLENAEKRFRTRKQAYVLFLTAALETCKISLVIVHNEVKNKVKYLEYLAIHWSVIDFQGAHDEPVTKMAQPVTLFGSHCSGVRTTCQVVWFRKNVCCYLLGLPLLVHSIACISQSHHNADLFVK